jgi:hypothetical protein
MGEYRVNASNEPSREGRILKERSIVPTKEPAFKRSLETGGYTRRGIATITVHLGMEHQLEQSRRLDAVG